MFHITDPLTPKNLVCTLHLSADLHHKGAVRPLVATVEWGVLWRLRNSGKYASVWYVNKQIVLGCRIKDIASFVKMKYLVISVLALLYVRFFQTSEAFIQVLIDPRVSTKISRRITTSSSKIAVSLSASNRAIFRLNLGAKPPTKSPDNDSKLPSNSSESKKVAGLEPKYVVAIGIFLSASLFDFFVVHHGQPYLAHPLWYQIMTPQ